jgi:Fungal specific transcription factor domain
MARLTESLTLPVSEQRHPALMNAIFLWSCYVSRPGPLCQHESHYLSRALESLGDALRHADKVVDVVQASCLLSLYFLSNGRMLEGGYHASAAASLAAQFGLDRGTPQQNFEPLHAIKIDSAKDSIEEGERILAFWQAYNLDYCWSVVLRKSPVIRDGRYAFTSVSTPWSRDAEDYETVCIINFRICWLTDFIDSG